MAMCFLVQIIAYMMRRVTGLTTSAVAHQIHPITAQLSIHGEILDLLGRVKERHLVLVSILRFT